MNGIAKWIDCHCSNKSEAGSNSLLYSPLIEVVLVPACCRRDTSTSDLHVVRLNRNEVNRLIYF